MQLGAREPARTEARQTVMTHISPRVAALAALLLLALLGVTACSGLGSDSTESVSGGGTTGDVAPEAAAGDSAADARPPGFADSASDGGTDAGGGKDADGGTDAGGGSAGGDEGSGEGGAEEEATGAARAPLRTESIIQTGTVSLVCDDVGVARFEVQKIADQHGGMISKRELYGDGDGGTQMARLELRVPVAAFDTVLAELEKLGRAVDTTTAAEDVTQQLIDLESRIAVQRASVDRIRALLAQASDLEEIVRIESELTHRQADLDSLLQQQAYLADRSALSTITVHLEQRAAAEEREEAEEDEGFLAGFAAGWKALAAFALVVATIGGALLPWLVVLALLGVPAWALIRRRRTPAPAATE